MRCPNCITIDVNSFVLITECSGDKQGKHHRVSIFTPQLGQFVTSFGDREDNCQLKGSRAPFINVHVTDKPCLMMFSRNSSAAHAYQHMRVVTPWHKIS